MREFTEEQLERYSRNIILREVGIEGQARFLEAKVLVIGAGGLGAPAAFYLAAAGVGTIGIADSDVVDRSNLQRQIIHFTEDIGTPKVESARAKMLALNPGITVRTYHTFISADNIREIIREYDFIIDGTDNFAAKFLINDACVLERKPFSHAGILRFEGQAITVVPGESPCVRCVFGGPPPRDLVPTCSQAGILGAVAGILGSIQAAEALKFISGAGETSNGRMVICNAKTLEFRTATFRKNSACPVCGEHPILIVLRDGEQAACDLTSRSGGEHA